jgi:hypothetical protein
MGWNWTTRRSSCKARVSACSTSKSLRSDALWFAFLRRVAELGLDGGRNVFDEAVGVDLHHHVFAVHLHEGIAFDALGERRLAAVHLEEERLVAADQRLQDCRQLRLHDVGQWQAEFSQVAEHPVERALFAVAPLPHAKDERRRQHGQHDAERNEQRRARHQRQGDQAAGDRDKGGRKQLAHERGAANGRPQNTRGASTAPCFRHLS